MIEAYIPTYGSGGSFFTGSFNPLAQTMQENSLTTAILILSDALILDRSWRFPVDAVADTSGALYRVVNELISRRVAREVDLSRVLTLDECKEALSSALLGLVEHAADYVHATVPDEFLSLLTSKPIETVRAIADSVDNLPPALRGLDITPALDAVLTGIAVGRMCDRVYDPRGYLTLLRNLTKPTVVKQEQTTYDWAITAFAVSLPKVPIFVTRSSRPGRLAQPLESLRFRPTVRPHRGRADTDASLRTLDRILKVRDSSAARDLRMAYANLIAIVTKGDLAVERLPHSPELWRQWRYAKAELTKACRVARTLEYWTDVLTVPAAVAAVFMPVVAAVPILTWAGSKGAKHFALAKHAQRHPWYFFAEQLPEVGLKLKEAAIVQSEAR